MKKLVNLRIPAVCAASLAMGIIYSAILAYFGIGGIYILAPVAAFLFACVVLCLKTKNFKYVYILIFAALIFIVGAVYMYCVFNSYNTHDLVDGSFVKISGRVIEDGVTSGGSRYIIVRNPKVYGKRIGGKLLAYINEDKSGDYCQRGYTVSFYAFVTKESFISNGEISYRAIDKIRYFGTAYTLEAEYHFSMFGSINSAIKQALFKNAGEETAAVCFALLTGDTTAVSYNTLSAFRYGGIAHVFAVSGLHIGVIYGVLSFIFKKTHTNRFIAAVIKIFFITFYAGICNFTPSSVRAVIMCSVSSMASCIYRKSDGWNSASVAAIILLLINPLYLFDLGFVLSFSAVLGIILLGHNISKAFFFLPAKLRDLLSVGWAAQLATMPVSFNKFGYVSAAGLVLNLVFIPIISVLYVMLFVCTVLSLIFPFAAQYLILVANVPIEFLISIVISCGFEKAIISANFDYFIYLPFQFLFFAISDKFNVKDFIRLSGLGAFLFSIIAVVLSKTIVTNPQITFNTGFSGGYAVVKTKHGTVVAVTSNYTGYINCPENVEAIVVLGDDYGLNSVFDLDISANYVYLRGSTISFQDLGNTQVICADRFTVCGVQFEFDNNVLYISSEGVKAAIVTEEEDNYYGIMPKDSQLNLYCYGDDYALLYDANDSYFNLTYTGAISYTLKDGLYKHMGAVPRKP